MYKLQLCFFAFISTDQKITKNLIEIALMDIRICECDKQKHSNKNESISISFNCYFQTHTKIST